MMISLTTVTCPCGARFNARTADVNRGWGKFCSKACKAKYKTAAERNPASDLDRVTAERDALQALLTAADERADVLEVEVARLNRVKLALKELVESHAGNLSVYRYHLSETLAMAEKVRDASLGMQRKYLADLIDYLHQNGAALKPAEGGGDEE